MWKIRKKSQNKANLMWSITNIITEIQNSMRYSAKIAHKILYILSVRMYLLSVRVKSFFLWTKIWHQSQEPVLSIRIQRSKNNSDFFLVSSVIFRVKLIYCARFFLLLRILFFVQIVNNIWFENVKRFVQIYASLFA